MKTIVVSVISLAVGTGAGLFYGWRTGFVDGQTFAASEVIPIINAYGALRGTESIQKRDLMIDALSIKSAGTFLKGKSYSPMYMFFHPMADTALMNTLIAWQLDHPESPKFTTFNPAVDSHIDRLKIEYKDYWDAEIVRQKSKREETIRNLRTRSADQKSTKTD